MKNEYIVAFVLAVCLMIMIVYLDVANAFTDAEILANIDAEVAKHQALTEKIMMAIGAVGSVLLSWIFKLMSDNKRRINEIDLELTEEHNKAVKELYQRIDTEKEKRVMDKQALDLQMQQNCQIVNDKIENHKLYVANNYTKDNKIQHMIDTAFKPMHEQISVLQQTVNLLVTKLNVAERRVNNRIIDNDTSE